MELTIASALSTDALLGHLGYLLLVVSMLMRRMVWLRIIVLVSSLTTIAYAVLILSDPVAVFWETLLIVVNVIQLLITWRQNTTADFTAEERAFAERRLRGLSPGEQRMLLNLGDWGGGAAGTTLTREGTDPDALYYLTAGEVEIETGGTVVAACGPGSYVGEMSLVGNRPASATARAVSEIRFWRIDRTALGTLEIKRPTWLAVVEAGIARDMRNKIVSANLARGPDTAV